MNDQSTIAGVGERAPQTGGPGDRRRESRAATTVGALGVIFGTIGTSPLYAIDQIFFGPSAVAASAENVIGAISLTIWTLTLVVCVNYAIFMLRAENDGEGGVFALYGLIHKYRNKGGGALLWSLMLGAGLLLGDSMITPAISVLSAVEGVEVAAPSLATDVLPATLVLLTGLFAIQYRGTGRIGAMFGLVLIVWFVAIAALGIGQIVRQPFILAAFNPAHGLAFLSDIGWRPAAAVLGAVLLVAAGGEAMHADLGHFGARPIRLAWFGLVYPALLLNYMGQGAHLLGGEPTVDGKLFFSLAPEPLLGPFVVLATMAAVVASQGLISGAFSLAAQAIGIGLFPRLVVRHTHLSRFGQIYIPAVNWGLYVGCVALVLGFRSTNSLASAYGITVAGVMTITALAMFPIARRYWKWGALRTGLVWGLFSAIACVFLLASCTKFNEGGWVPALVGFVMFFVMATWRWGRKATFAAYEARSTMTMADLVALHRREKSYLERNALIMAPTQVRRAEDRAPALVSLLWERYGVLPRNLILVEIIHPKVPHIHEDRYHVTVFDRGENRSVIGVQIRFGFMEEPNVERWLEDMARHKEIDLSTHPRQWIVHVSHENLVPARRLGTLKTLRLRLFLLLRLASRPAYYAYGLGDEVQLSSEIMPVRVS